MAHEIVMPRVDMDMASGRMGRWHAAEGAHVIQGETLFEIETDKAAMEVEAPASGVLRFVGAQEGDVLPVGACIGWIVAEGEDFVPAAATADAAALAGAVGRPPQRPAVEGSSAPPAAGRRRRMTPPMPQRRWVCARRPPRAGRRASAACASRTPAAPDRTGEFSCAISTR
ncbi:MAG: hypothetical protein JO288_19360 [Hyphomicrobiales bacterium]|nr:hypothetical protein [Hyphomicrobiales bacterium]